MTITSLSLKSTFSRSTIAKSILGAAAAVALLFAAPAKSGAQVVFRAQFGGPVAVAPVYRYGYYDQRRAYIEHEEWLRAHRYDRDYFYNRDRRDRDSYYYDRNRRDRDRDDRDRYDRDRR
jgi:hypothetical protein